MPPLLSLFLFPFLPPGILPFLGSLSALFIPTACSARVSIPTLKVRNSEEKKKRLALTSL